MNEKDLLETGYKKYTGEDIDVYFHKEKCIHSTRCVKGHPEVFDIKRRPWILPDNGTASNVAKVIDTCPSGALKYIYSGESKALPEKPTDDYEEE